MQLQSNEDSTWGSSLDDFKPELTSIKVWNLIQFYTLKGRTTSMIKSNLEPLTIQYALHSPQEEKYYLKDFRRYSIDDLVLRPGRNLDLDQTDFGIKNIRRYFVDGNLYLLFDETDMENTKLMLKRVYKAQFTDDGTMQYKLFIDILSETINYEDYRDYGRNLTGFKTVSNQYEQRIKELWNKSKKNKT
jgi:hypothetical protein